MVLVVNLEEGVMCVSDVVVLFGQSVILANLYADWIILNWMV